MEKSKTYEEELDEWQRRFAYWRAREVEIEREADSRRRRADFRAGYEYFHAVMLSEISKTPKPDLPEWAK